MRLTSNMEIQKVKTIDLESLKQKLNSMSLFSQLSSDDLKGLVEKSSLRQFEAGSVICREGEYGDTAFAILGGAVEVSINTAGYENLTLALLGEGNIFSEMAALSGYPRSATVSAKEALYLLEDERRTATVSAFTNVEVLQVLKEDFNMLLDADSKLAEEIGDIIMERKLRTLKVQKDPSKSERLQTLVEKGIIQTESLLIIDLKTCIHCNKCVDACEDRHGYPRLDRRGTRVPDVSIPVARRLCHDPVCLICNFDAIKRAPTGEINIIDDKCVGCAGCAIRCPYNVIQMFSSKPEHDLKKFNIISALLKGAKESDNKTPKDSKIKPKHLAIKCDNCLGYHDTACTNNCPTNSIKWVNPMEYFGDTEDLIPKREKYQ